MLTLKKTSATTYDLTATFPLTSALATTLATVIGVSTATYVDRYKIILTVGKDFEPGFVEDSISASARSNGDPGLR